MILHLSRRDRLQWHFRRRAAVFTGIVAMCFAPLVARPRILQTANGEQQRCSSLHAGIRAGLVRSDPNGSRPAFVLVNFVLVNDGEVPVNSTAGGWQIVIDGKEVRDDSGLIFFNGMQPDGGYGVLNPGESYALDRQLEISRYLPKLGEHTLSWKGQLFQSSTIKINVTAQ
jgi:hypothetical protein